ncbi:cache domain-containing protein [Acinetobacter sichuanensis]|uniref:Cache domain-containing protein n=1 Tax=Acinetobacter sichuanensis TaxID=2136183 RepID=A0A371YLV8_9GAMM|nr:MULTISPECIES: cache domain-containing protein [Acinetobacter]MDM1246253.1 histidine kinase [Acinetobacter sp. R933-2]MDM1764293.1 histidine kinase [Acinetobacter sp. 226-1]MDM1767810.1 histidine kinase [Acinetobacter sp. 226-4]RFC82430.1 histidine kinase [Acinetobacter sichuanensis]
MTQNLYVKELQELLKQVIDETTSTAERLAKQASQICAQHQFERNKGIKLSVAERTALQQEIKMALYNSSYSQGMGFASYSPETLEEQDYWTLEWWYKKEGKLQQAQLENYQNAQRFLDFRSFEWFQQPARNNQPCFYGPYVDYICNGAYTITIAHPVMLNEQFIGVIATDVLVSALEKILMPKLKNIKQKAVIINNSARVISSNDVSIRIGTLLKNQTVQVNTRPSASLQLVLV